MGKKLKEQTIILISVIKWFILASIIGVITGFSTALYVKVLNWSVFFTGRYRYYFILMPLGLLASGLMVKYLSPGIKAPGVNYAIEAVHKKAGRIKAILVPLGFIASIITVASGGSTGKEGPSVQVGSGLASLFSDIFKFDEPDRQKLVICGICGAFASVFGAPITGALYGVEVLAIGSIFYEVLLPAFISGIISYHVSSWFGITYLYHSIKVNPVFSELFFIKVVFAGIFFGFCSFILIEAVRLGKSVSERLRLPMEIKSVLAGLVLVFLTFAFSTHPLGLGINVMESAIAGNKLPWYDFILKIFYTSVTLNFGGVGGKVAPMVFIGATSGNVFGRVMNVDPAMFSAIGFISVLAGASNTPIAASVFAVELFGPAIAPYAATAAVISFITTGHRSSYPSQLLTIRKSSSIEVELGKELKDVYVQFEHSDTSLIGAIRRLGTKIFKSGGNG